METQPVFRIYVYLGENEFKPLPQDDILLLGKIKLKISDEHPYHLKTLVPLPGALGFPET